MVGESVLLTRTVVSCVRILQVKGKDQLDMLEAFHGIIGKWSLHILLTFFSTFAFVMGCLIIYMSKRNCIN